MCRSARTRSSISSWPATSPRSSTTTSATAIADRGLGNGDSFFPLPEPMIQGPATRVMSLRDGTKKMSKSDPSDYSRINLTDDAETIAQKIRKAKTDPEPLPSEEKGLEGRPEADNLVGIYAGAVRQRPRPRCWRSSAAASSPPSRAALVDLAVTKLAPIAGEMRRLLADVSHIDAILHDGADRARRHRRADHARRQGHRRLRPALSARASPAPQRACADLAAQATMPAPGSGDRTEPMVKRQAVL